MSSLNEILSSSSRGLRLAFSFQVYSKLISFTLNALVIRRLDPSTKGIIFTLELFAVSILTLSRESFRNTSVRIKPDSKKDGALPLLVKLGLMFVPVGFVYLFVGGFIHYFFVASNEIKSHPYLMYTFIMYMVGVALEMLSEPFYLIANNLNLYSLKVKIEGIGLLVKVVLCMVFVEYIFPREREIVLLSFGIGQVGFGVTIFICFVKYFMNYRLTIKLNEIFSLKGEKTKETILLTFSFLLHEKFKFIITEGEKYILMFFEQLSSLGTYDVVSRLGSLIIRMCFKPMNDISYNTWSQLLHHEDRTEGKKKTRKMFILFMKILLFIGTFFVVFVPPYSFSVIHFLYGGKWSRGTEAPKLLTMYSFYVFFCSLNGVTEALVRAAFTKEEIRTRLLRWSVFVSISYLLISILVLHFFKMGAYGLILANIFNMLVRITFSLNFITKFYHIKKSKSRWGVLLKCLFGARMFLVFVVVSVITNASKVHFSGTSFINFMSHCGVGFMMVLVCLGSLYSFEKEFCREVKGMLMM